MKQTLCRTLCVLILCFSAVPAFAQTRAYTAVYVRDVAGGTPEEQRALQQRLKTEVRALGFPLTEDRRAADYVLHGDIQAGALRVLRLTLLNAVDRELDSTVLVVARPEEAYEQFPLALASLFGGQPLRDRPAPRINTAPETAAAPATGGGTGGSTGGSTGGGSSIINNGIMNSTITISSTGNGGLPGGPSSEQPAAAPAPNPAEPAAAPAAWKYKWLFLNTRLGVSNRYYLSDTDGIPDVSIFTVDAGMELEFHPVNSLALQFGVNYGLDRADYEELPLHPLYTTSVLSVPVMVKYLFNTGAAATLGLYLGGYASYAFLGSTTPPPFGVLGGLDLAVKAGPGALLFDIRYSMDLDSTDVDAAEITSYDRMFLTLSAGYKFGLIPRRARPRPR